MDDKTKKILELAAKFIENRGCVWAEFDLDAWNYRPWGEPRRFQCSTDGQNKGGYLNLPFDISNILSELCEENASEISEEYEDYSNGYFNLNSLECKFIPSERTLRFVGIYQGYGEGAEEIVEKEIDAEILEKLKERGILKATVEFHGGGDSGYFENLYGEGEDQKDIPTDSIHPDFDDFLGRVLDNYGDWYNNEGANGNIVIDTEEGMATAHVYPQEEIYEDVPLFSVTY